MTMNAEDCFKRFGFIPKPAKGYSKLSYFIGLYPEY
jgi:hypothetical protein